MNKQTKQILILIVLVVVAGGVAVFWTMGGDDGPKPAPANDNGGAATPSNPTPNQPAGGGATPSTPGGAGPGATPQVAAPQDLDMPEEAKITPSQDTWEWAAPAGGKDDPSEVSTGGTRPFDPLMVQNIDVVDPERKQYIEDLKQQWVLDGIIETRQRVPVVDEKGKPKLGPDGEPIMEVRMVLEAMFKDRRRPYRVKDRLTNTRFTIKEIFTSRVYRIEGSDEIMVRDGVDLIGDTGANITLFLTDDTRYEATGDNK